MGLLDRPSSGKVCIGGKDTSKISGKEIALFRGQKLGFVFQNYNLIPRLTVLENVILPGLIMQKDPEMAAFRRVYERFIQTGRWSIRDFPGATIGILGKEIREKKVFTDREEYLKNLSPEELEKYCFYKFRTYGWEIQND